MADSSPPSIPKGFEPLQSIGENLYLYEPLESKEANVGPSLIVLFTWLGGSTSRRIQKYLTGYRSLWPRATILLVTTRMLEFVALPFSALHARLAPAREAIHQHMGGRSAEKGKPSILLHIFSNGGLYTAVHLALSLQEDQKLDIGSHIRGIVLDCCPGQTEFQRTYTAATFALPPGLPAQLLGKPFLFFLVGLVTNLTHAGLLSGVKDLRRQLNDPAVFGSSARRLYLYSKADEIVGWEDVESHMKEAKVKRGYEVEGVAFSDSQHCALVRRNEAQYWDAIEKFWERPSLSTQDDSISSMDKLPSRL